MEMDEHDKEKTSDSKIGDLSTSDVVVRLRTQEGRDARLYCHSNILKGKSRYFAERLSDSWPTCQILDSRDCVEVYCQESDFNDHVAALRLLYLVKDDGSVHDPWHGVQNALGILQVAVKLGCEQMVRACVEYLEAVPWEEAEEEEILRIIPNLGPEVEPILSRLQPVDSTAILRIFLSTIRFATSSPPPSMNDLKSTAQEQLEYMLAEDDDAPLLAADDELKSQVRDCMRVLLKRFYDSLDPVICQSEEAVLEAYMLEDLQSLLADLAWACSILAKMETMRDFVQSWVDMSDKIVMAVQCASQTPDALKINEKVIAVAAKVLEAIAYGTVILPTSKRLHMVKVWLPFVRVAKFKSDSSGELKVDTDLWQSLESALVSMVLALPSGDQAEILTDWLGTTKHIQYPDLTEAFEVWCYRSKVAKRRLRLLDEMRQMGS